MYNLATLKLYKVYITLLWNTGATQSSVQPKPSLNKQHWS